MKPYAIRPARILAVVAAVGGALAGAVAAQESGPVGDWAGEVTPPGGAAIPLILHVTQAEDGSLAATLDSPSQGAFGIPGASASFEEGTLSMSFDAIPGGSGFEGTMSEDGSMLEGNWSQGPGSMPLTLTRSDGSTEG